MSISLNNLTEKECILEGQHGNTHTDKLKCSDKIKHQAKSNNTPREERSKL